MNNRNALVTGASRGIGLAIARELARKGFDLTITSRTQADLDRVASELGALGSGKVHPVAADMSDSADVERLAEGHARRFTTMDVLVLNAGVGTAGTIAGFPDRRSRKTFEVNFFAQLKLLQEAIPLLRAAAAAAPEHGARVIALSSITGAYAESGLAVYGASKAALISLIETLTLEEAPNGILGTAIAPGYVETDMSAWTTDTITAQSMIPASDVARLVGALVDMGRQSVVTKIVMSRAAADAYTA
jgi:NAD(P)-dependent dehydrogenase (short-subunit alcohol dehydrogenase family)